MSFVEKSGAASNLGPYCRVPCASRPGCSCSTRPVACSSSAPSTPPTRPTPGGTRSAGPSNPGRPCAAPRSARSARRPGLVVAEDDLHGPVWRRLVRFPFDGHVLDAEEWYFTATVDDAQGSVDTSGFTDLEVRTVLEHRWWSMAELATTSEVVWPLRLAELLPTALTRTGEPLLLDER